MSSEFFDKMSLTYFVDFGDTSSLDELLSKDPRLLSLIDLYSFKKLISCLCKFRKDVYGRSYSIPECDIVMTWSIRRSVPYWAVYLSYEDDYLQILSNLTEVNLDVSLPETALVYACRLGRTKAVLYLLEEGVSVFVTDLNGKKCKQIADESGFEQISSILSLVQDFQHYSRQGNLTRIINFIVDGKNIAPFKQWFSPWLSDQNRDDLETWIKHQENSERNTYNLLYSKYDANKSQMRRLKEIDTIRMSLLSFLVYPTAKTRNSIRYIKDHIKRYRAWHFIFD
jgi:ankyrin repeat protein